MAGVMGRSMGDFMDRFMGDFTGGCNKVVGSLHASSIGAGRAPVNPRAGI